MASCACGARGWPGGAQCPCNQGVKVQCDYNTAFPAFNDTRVVTRHFSIILE